MGWGCHRDILQAYGVLVPDVAQSDDDGLPHRSSSANCLNVVYPEPYVSAGFMPYAPTTPVGWIVLNDISIASCFLISDDWIATAKHVFANSIEAAGHFVVFNYLQDGAPGSRDAYALAPEGDGFLEPADSDLDFCLVRVARKADGTAPGSKWGQLRLTGGSAVKQGDPVLLVHHPNKLKESNSLGPPQYEHYKCYSVGSLLEAEEPFIWHSACARPNSSGSPVIAPDGHVFAIHKGKLDDLDPDGRWLATPVSRIVKHLRDHCLLTPEQAALLEAD